MKKAKVKRQIVKVSCDTSECMKSLAEVEKKISLITPELKKLSDLALNLKLNLKIVKITK